MSDSDVRSSPVTSGRFLLSFIWCFHLTWSWCFFPSNPNTVVLVLTKPWRSHSCNWGSVVGTVGSIIIWHRRMRLCCNYSKLCLIALSTMCQKKRRYSHQDCHNSEPLKQSNVLQASITVPSGVMEGHILCCLVTCTAEAFVFSWWSCD